MIIYSSQGLRWTPHSLMRLRDRGISVAAVRAALASPHLRYPSRHGGGAYQVVTGANGLVVVLDPAQATVVTAYWRHVLAR